MPAAPRNGQPWPAEETQRLKEMVASGMTTSQIAEALGRTSLGIKHKAKALGIRPRSAELAEHLPPASPARSRGGARPGA